MRSKESVLLSSGIKNISSMSHISNPWTVNDLNSTDEVAKMTSEELGLTVPATQEEFINR